MRGQSRASTRGAGCQSSLAAVAAVSHGSQTALHSWKSAPVLVPAWQMSGCDCCASCFPTSPRCVLFLLNSTSYILSVPACGLLQCSSCCRPAPVSYGQVRRSRPGFPGVTCSKLSPCGSVRGPACGCVALVAAGALSPCAHQQCQAGRQGEREAGACQQGAASAAAEQRARGCGWVPSQAHQAAEEVKLQQSSAGGWCLNRPQAAG